MNAIESSIQPLKLDHLSVQNILITILIHSTQYFPKLNSINRLVTIQYFIHKATTNLKYNLIAEIRKYDFELLRFFLNSVDQISCIEDLFALMDKSQGLLFDRNENHMIWGGEEENVFRIERDSYFGLILRRFIIQFEELMFDDLSNLMEQWNLFKSTLDFKVSYYNSDEMECLLHSLPFNEVFENTIREIEEHFPKIPKIHYLRHLHAMKERNWNVALDSLHRYFDYFHEITGNEQGAAQSKIASFAGLNLAALYYHFGYYESAVYAIKETIRVAQQKGEEDCVSLSLVWLFRLENKNPAPGSSHETITLVKKCIDRCRNLGLPQALVETLLFSVQVLISKRTESYENTTRSQDSNLPSKLEMIIHEAKMVAAESNLEETLLPTTEMTSAAVWREIGYKELGNLHLTNVCIEGNEEAILVQIVHSARNLLDSGQYVASLKKLATFTGNVVKNEFWNRHMYDILFDHARRKNEVNKARTLLSLMKRIASSEDFEYRTMIMWREANLELQLNNTRQATKIVEQGIEICNKLNLDTNLVHLLHTDAIIKLRGKSKLPSINSIMEGITICEKRYLIRTLSKFKILLAEVQQFRNAKQDAAKILKGVLPYLLENGDPEDIGNSVLLEATISNKPRLAAHAYSVFESIDHYFGMLKSLQLKHRLSPSEFTKEDEQLILKISSKIHYNAKIEKPINIRLSQVAQQVLEFEIQEAEMHRSQIS